MSALRIIFNPGFTMADVQRNIAEMQRKAINVGARQGAARGAALMQQDAQETSAYKGMSGATRAGTVGFVADAEGKAGFEQAYSSVTQKLRGYTGHDGEPYRTPQPAPSPSTIAVVLTVPTDYIDKLEIERAGEKAFLGPTLQQDARTVTALIADASREELGQ